MYWSELQTQLIGGLLKGSQTQATFFLVDVSAQGDMKQLTLFNLVTKIFYYNDFIIAVCECHEQKPRFECYFKTEWDGYIRLPNARKHLKPRRRRPSGFIIVFEFLEITSPTKKLVEIIISIRFLNSNTFYLSCEPVTYLVPAGVWLHYFICIQCCLWLLSRHVASQYTW